MGKKLGEL